MASVNQALLGAVFFASMVGLSACNDGDDATTRSFNRVASFAVCSQIDAGCDTNVETSAEIVAASDDGMTLIYTDSPAGQIGFVDISDPMLPQGLGTLVLAGEPTSVAVKGQYALVGLKTSADFVNDSGTLIVVDISSRQVVAEHSLAGQPDSVAVSPDGRFAAVAIENERDEDLGDGAPPQLPAGLLNIITLVGPPTEWQVSAVGMSNIATLYPGDPEPEFVDINSDNVAVVSLQENNHVILVNLESGSVIG